MKKEVKDLWIKALRSGEFKQGRGKLHQGEKSCVLGVLSLLAMVEGHCTFQPGRNGARFDGKRFSLSYNVRAWAGIGLDQDEDGELVFKSGSEKVPVVYKGEKTNLVELNDNGLTFKELAKIIEEQL